MSVNCKNAYIFKDQFKKYNSIRHNDEKPYHCNYHGCNISFGTPSRLLQHIEAVHKKKINYKCNYNGCGKGFYMKLDYDRHFRIHTGEKPYKCKYCSKQFTQSCNLTKHINQVHKKLRPYTCYHCHHSFGANLG